MFFLNLTAAEFGALLGVAASIVTALYLFDRTRRKRVVSTLRFWTPGLVVQQTRRRRRVQEPWSLLLQLVGVCLLLLAIGQLQFGPRARRGRDHVLLLDTSAWSAQRRGAGTLLDEEKRAAEQYASAVPANDRILLVAADALATPLCPFTSDRARLGNALRAAHSGFSALNLQQALLFVRRAVSGSEGAPGEVIYIGPGMITRSDLMLPQFRNLRVVQIAPNRDHIGIRAARIQADATDAREWRATVTVMNYGRQPANVALRVHSGDLFSRRLLSLPAGEETSADYEFLANGTGAFAAEIEAGADLEGDHHVALALPPLRTARIDVVTSRAEQLRPLFEAHAHTHVRFFSPGQYIATADTDLIVFDKTTGTVPGGAAAIWIDPPRDQAPWPLKTIVDDARITAWHSETPLAAALRTKQAHLGRASVFQAFESDIVVASVAAGPVVIARDASGERGKRAVVGFDPLNSQARFELTTPLLFAHLLRWSLPDVFEDREANAERVGAITVPLEAGARRDRIRVVDQQGALLPFLTTRNSIELFVSRPQILEVMAEARQRTVSAVLPDVAAFAWTPPSGTVFGLPERAPLTPGATDLWRALALLGVTGLFAEWMLFGRQRKRKESREAQSRAARASTERELVAR